MRTLLAISAALLIAAVPTLADAKSGSQFAPGQQFRANGPTGGRNGASGYAPGQQFRANGAVAGTHGASGYSPGHKKR